MNQQNKRKTQGFSLIELALVLLIGGLAFGMIVGVTGSLREGQQRSTIRTQLETIDTALANFVTQYKRLPCPANGAIASDSIGAGQETLSAGPPPATLPPKGTCDPNNQLNGVVPWITLGLSEADITDPWGARISYRVDPALAAGSPFPALMDMSNCDPSSSVPASPFPAISACKTPVPSCTNTSGCTSPTEFLFNKGLDVWDGVNGATGWSVRQNNRGAGTGAAYVLISHGVSGTAAYNAKGLLQPGSIAAGANEIPNRNNSPLILPATLASTYRDAAMDDRVSTTHFDDYLSHPTIMTVLMKANLGPRAHP